MMGGFLQSLSADETQALQNRQTAALTDSRPAVSSIESSANNVWLLIRQALSPELRTRQLDL